MNHLTFLAPAKLNLYLAVTGRLPEGYHQLQTLFVFTNLADELTFKLTHTGKVNLQTSANLAGLNLADNLVYQAAVLLQQKLLQQEATSSLGKQSLGVDIYLTKRLPLGSGLGGGSSNAASCLLALNQLWQLGLSQEELAQLGLQLGADVPIFIYGKAAWATGRGEIFTPAKFATSSYLLIYPGVACNTGELFSQPNLVRNTSVIEEAELANTQLGYNAFEPLVRSAYPSIEKTFNWLASQGLTGYLTGSGSCIYAPATPEVAAKLAKTYPQTAASWQLKEAANHLQPQAWAIEASGLAKQALANS